MLHRRAPLPAVPGYDARVSFYADLHIHSRHSHDELERAVAERLDPSCHAPTRFMLSVEIPTIYRRGERTRKIHHLALERSETEARRAPAAKQLPLF